MTIDLQEITIRELTRGYVNNDEDGVVGYDGKLNIRPPFQREFVYKDKQRDAVMDTVNKGFPLNVMYWVKNGNGSFELLDGQQRTISICEYVHGGFALNNRFFDNLTDTEKARILDYKLMVYVCEGNDLEKLEWFKTINIAGEKLFDQELLNAMYVGEWLADAKRHFSKTNCPASNLAKDYLTGASIRQEYLETALRWISDGNGQAYMAEHQHDANAGALWHYFASVINWVKTTFPRYRKEMKGVEWGLLWNRFKTASVNPQELEAEVSRLMMDDDVTKKAGIYSYVLDGNERHLSIRAFTPNMKREAYERQGGICPKCGNHFELSEMEADHIEPWHAGGKTIASNCQMLCKPCNRRKSGI